MAKKRTPIYKVLYFQVICAIVCGVLLGYFAPLGRNDEAFR